MTHTQLLEPTAVVHVQRFAMFLQRQLTEGCAHALQWRVSMCTRACVHEQLQLD